jgi:hypothetical protein
MSQDGQACKPGERQRKPSSSSTPCVEAFHGLHIASSDTIYPALSNRRFIGYDENEARDTLILTFLLTEARRYEHAGCANRIHCR